MHGHEAESLPRLEDQRAPKLPQQSEKWIDVPVGCSEPAKAALFVSFLRERSIPFEQSRRFVSVDFSHTPTLIEELQGWAFRHGLIDDPRSTDDSLVSTLREIGLAVIEAIQMLDDAQRRSRESFASVAQRPDVADEALALGEDSLPGDPPTDPSSRIDLR